VASKARIVVISSVSRSCSVKRRSLPSVSGRYAWLLQDHGDDRLGLGRRHPWSPSPDEAKRLVAGAISILRHVIQEDQQVLATSIVIRYDAAITVLEVAFQLMDADQRYEGDLRFEIWCSRGIAVLDRSTCLRDGDGVARVNPNDPITSQSTDLRRDKFHALRKINEVDGTIGKAKWRDSVETIIGIDADSHLWPSF
jgi:hypothetical protein